MSVFTLLLFAAYARNMTCFLVVFMRCIVYCRYILCTWRARFNCWHDFYCDFNPLLRFCPARLSGGGVTFSACSFVRPSVCYQTCEHDILKTKEPILIQIGTIGPHDNGMTRSTLRVRRSKVKVTRRRNRSGGQSEASFSTSLGRLAFLVFADSVYHGFHVVWELDTVCMWRQCWDAELWKFHFALLYFAVK